MTTLTVQRNNLNSNQTPALARKYGLHRTSLGDALEDAPLGLEVYPRVAPVRGFVLVKRRRRERRGGLGGQLLERGQCGQLVPAADKRRRREAYYSRAGGHLGSLYAVAKDAAPPRRGQVLPVKRRELIITSSNDAKGAKRVLHGSIVARRDAYPQRRAAREPRVAPRAVQVHR